MVLFPVDHTSDVMIFFLFILESTVYDCLNHKMHDCFWTKKGQMWQEYHNSKVAQMVKNNGPKCIWSSGTLVDQLETFWTISDKTWILALKTQSAFWLSQWITVRFTILGHFGPFGPPSNTDEPAIFGLFWSKKSSLGLSSLQMTNNDQNQGDVRRRIIQMVICNNPCCSAPLILVVVGTVLFANYQQWPK